MRSGQLLLQSCCGPCSSYVLEYLTKYFSVSVLYYNPNIYPRAEYDKRLSEQRRLISLLPAENPVSIVECDYDEESFYRAAAGYETAPEGGARCEKCFRLRLMKTAQVARDMGFEYFGTTLTVSPHKNAQLINQIGQEVAKKYQIRFLPSDFKKREGYKRSITLSMKYDLYRQNYCGCIFSMNNHN